mmetsp:Transcript_93933/g.176548  ORF Transcript_93933/g.176548 Transcript_93933/m.176548 type:complete len:481 (+) Transcript_93933:69-1511(+)
MKVLFVVKMFGLLHVCPWHAWQAHAEKDGKGDKCAGWDCQPSKKMKAKYAVRPGDKGAFCDIPVYEHGKIPKDILKDASWRFKPFIIRKGSTLLQGGFAKDKLLENAKQRQITARYGHSWTIVRQNGRAKEETLLEDFIENLMYAKKYDGKTLLERPFLFHDFSDVFGIQGTQFSVHSMIKSWKKKSNLTFSPREATPVLLIGAGMSGVGFHRHSATLQMLAHGYKRWFFYPPEKSPPGGDHGGWPVYDWTDSVYPKLEADLKPIECIQKPDDLIWVPELWFHATLNLGDTVAVSIQHGGGETEGYHAQRRWSLLDIGHPKAEKYVNDIIKLQPDNWGAKYDMAVELKAKGEEERAVKLLREVLAADPFQMDSMKFLAQILEERIEAKKRKKAITEKQFEELLKDWLPTLELNPRSYCAQRLMSRYYELIQDRAGWEVHDKRLDFLESMNIDESGPVMAAVPAQMYSNKPPGTLPDGMEL